MLCIWHKMMNDAHQLRCTVVYMLQNLFHLNMKMVTSLCLKTQILFHLFIHIYLATCIMSQAKVFLIIDNEGVQNIYI